MYGVFGIVVLMTALLFLSPTLPYFGHIDLKIVKSGSMEPEIKTGGIVLVREAASYGVGDVVTFTSESSDIPTTHRIIGTEMSGGELLFVSKGDANEERDTNLVPASEIIGKVLFTMPYAGFVFDFARQPIGFALLIGLPALLIILDEIEKIWREIRRKKNTVVHVTRSTAAAIPPLVVAPYVPTRVRRMDIFRPTPVTPPEESKNGKQTISTVRVRKEVNSGWIMATSMVFALMISSANLWSTGSTISYFRDIESSLGSLLSAVALGFSATPDGSSFTFSDGVLDDPDGLITVVTPETQSVPLKYSLTTQYATGTVGLCNAITVDALTPFAYSGPLMELNATDVAFSGPWTLGIALTATTTYTVGDACTVTLRYRGWNAELEEGDGGYVDEEDVALTFTVLTPTPFAPSAALMRLSTELVEPPLVDETIVPTTEEETSGSEETPPVPEIPNETPSTEVVEPQPEVEDGVPPLEEVVEEEIPQEETPVVEEVIEEPESAPEPEVVA
jgi:signal peptidase I